MRLRDTEIFKRIHNIQFLSQVLVFGIVALTAFPGRIFAETLTTTSDSLSENVASATGVTHTINFTTATTDDLKQIRVRFSTTVGGSTKPAGLDLSSSTLGSLTGLGSGWSINTGQAGSGILYITRDTAVEVAASTAISIPFQNITNSAINDCGQAGQTLTDTCQVRISTFSDDGTTLVDSGDTTYFIIEYPNTTFEVKAVNSGQTNNGITSTQTSTDILIPAGIMRPGDVEYITQEIKITTNAPKGYNIYVYLADSLEGANNVDNIFSPFGATDATWNTPQPWATPTGTSANNNTGWVAANTTDTDIGGWSSASEKFGPISQIPHLVATSTSSARSGDSIFVTYAIGINGMQPTDQYTGKLIYDVQALY